MPATWVIGRLFLQKPMKATTITNVCFWQCTENYVMNLGKRCPSKNDVSEQKNLLSKNNNTFYHWHNHVRICKVLVSVSMLKCLETNQCHCPNYADVILNESTNHCLQFNYKNATKHTSRFFCAEDKNELWQTVIYSEEQKHWLVAVKTG